ncbi:hypothetical protein [Citrobacter koseri]|uniref:hypothetical protein n=1 Tax=Citrobacter koseri TaxID=545 RepID=UPI003BF57C5F
MDVLLASLGAGSDSNSHLASGPLSNDRLHRIREILSKAAAQRDGGNIGYAMSDAVKAIDELLEVRKAEPVGYYRKGSDGFYFASPTEQRPGTIPLYRHAQPAPVVPKSISVRQAISALESADVVTTIGQGYKMGWNACRAAMLQGAEPVKTANKLRDAVDAIRNSGIAIDAEKIFAERDALNSPDCWCRTCRPVTISDMRFVVCPECGNKRCPHANDHRNACTGSNEPGQEGSAYPAAPQQEVK